MRSYNKFLAKLASDMRKPDGIFVIDPHQAEEFLMKLEIGKFFDIDEITAENLRKMGIWNGADLYARSLETMIWIFGKRGLLSFAESTVGK